MCDQTRMQTIQFTLANYALPEPAKRGDSIEPGVERSVTPGLQQRKKGARETGDGRFIKRPIVMQKPSQRFLYRPPPRAVLFRSSGPGVPLRSTPETMKPGLPKSI